MKPFKTDLKGFKVVIVLCALPFVADVFCYLGPGETAHCIYGTAPFEMQQWHMKPDAITYNASISACVKVRPCALKQVRPYIFRGPLKGANVSVRPCKSGFKGLKGVNGVIVLDMCSLLLCCIQLDYFFVWGGPFSRPVFVIFLEFC